MHPNRNSIWLCVNHTISFSSIVSKNTGHVGFCDIPSFGSYSVALSGLCSFGSPFHGGCARACGAHFTPACHLPPFQGFVLWGAPSTGVAFAPAALTSPPPVTCRAFGTVFLLRRSLRPRLSPAVPSALFSCFGAHFTPACHPPCLRHCLTPIANC